MLLQLIVVMLLFVLITFVGYYFIFYSVRYNAHIGSRNIAVLGTENQVDRDGKKSILVSKFCVYASQRNLHYPKLTKKDA